MQKLWALKIRIKGSIYSVGKLALGSLFFFSILACQKNHSLSTGLIGDGLMSDRPVMAAQHQVYLLELSQEPLLTQSYINAQGILEVDPAKMESVKKEQSQLEEKMVSLSSEIRTLYRYKYILNALAVIAPSNLEDSLKDLPGVKKLQRHQVFSRPKVIQQLDLRKSLSFVKERTSVTHIEAGAAYEMGIRGQGIRIGVLDTGIDYTHSMLGGSGLVEDFKNADLIGPNPQFPNKKIVGGIDLVGSRYDAASLDPDRHLPRPDGNPLDEGGHGTHVAGTIAGIGDGQNSYDGVAPEASLYAIKVFGSGSTSDEVVIAGLEWAVDPNQDGVLDDKLHVVNLSLGGGNGTPYELYNKAVTNLSHSGTVVVASAGNSSNVPFIVGSPSTSDEALSVAANIDSSDHNWKFKTVGFMSNGERLALAEALEGQSGKSIEEAGDVRGELVYAGLADKDYSDEEAALIKGKVALVDRGLVTFQEKYERVAKAGAIGLILAQNRPEPPFTMGGDKVTEIPGIMISQELGQKLKDQMEKASVEVVFQNPEMMEKPELINRITSFSSRGPRSVDLLIKPEITAPGQNIISAAMGKGTEGIQMSGTSMSGPHMAGVMGLMKQRHPRLSSRDLKSLVMSTAIQVKNENGEIDSVARQGAGQVMVSRALKAQFVSDPVSLSLGLQQIEKSKRLVKTLRLKSLWDDEVKLKVGLETASAAISLDSQELTLKPQGVTDLRLNLMLRASAVAGLEEEISGWIVLTSSNGNVQKIPFLTRLQKVSDIKLAKVDLGAESRLEMEGTQSYFTFANKSLHGGEAWLFNLLGVDSRKVASDNPFISRECDLKAVGYRLTESHLELAVKFFNRVTVWSLCEVSVMLDKDHDRKPEAELALTVQERIAGMSGEKVVTTLLDYKKARELRKTTEEKAKEQPDGEKRVELDLTSAVVSSEDAVASELRSAVILRVSLSDLKDLVGVEPRIQILSSAQEYRNIEVDDYLKDKDRWMKLSLVPQDQSWLRLQNLSLQGGETRQFEAEKGAGRQPLLMVYPNNSLDSRALFDEQSQVYRPRFSEKEQELKPVNP